MSDSGTKPPARGREVHDWAEGEIADCVSHSLSLSAEQCEDLMRELELHLLELETQNEALRLAQAELEYSRSRYADLHDFSPVGYLVVDVAGAIRDLNLTAASMLGSQRSQLIGRPLAALLRAEDELRWADFLRRGSEAKEGAKLSVELGLPNRAGANRTIEIRTVVVQDPACDQRRYRSALIDISSIRQSEKVRQAGWAAALEAAEAGLWQLDPENGGFVCLGGMQAMLGLPAEAELTRASVLECLDPAHRVPLAAALQRAVESGDKFQVESRIVLPDGTVRWLSWRGQLRQTCRGTRLAGLLLDVAGQPADAAQRSQRQRQLEQQVSELSAEGRQRNEQLRRLAAALGDAEHRERQRLAQLLHGDLQQLLIAARMRVSAICETADGFVARQAEEVDQILNECITSSRQLTIELSPPVPPQSGLAEIAQWLAVWFRDKHGLEVAVQMSAELPPLRDADRSFLFQAARELLLNAVKHSGSREAHLALACTEGWLVLEVQDGGHGFEPQAVFRSLDRAQSFGLRDLRGRLELVGGRLEIQRTPQGGGCFRLFLPL